MYFDDVVSSKIMMVQNFGAQSNNITPWCKSKTMPKHNNIDENNGKQITCRNHCPITYNVVKIGENGRKMMKWNIATNCWMTFSNK